MRTGRVWHVGIVLDRKEWMAILVLVAEKSETDRGVKLVDRNGRIYRNAPPELVFSGHDLGVWFVTVPRHEHRTIVLGRPTVRHSGISVTVLRLAVLGRRVSSCFVLDLFWHGLEGEENCKHSIIPLKSLLTHLRINWAHGRLSLAMILPQFAILRRRALARRLRRRWWSCSRWQIRGRVVRV